MIISADPFAGGARDSADWNRRGTWPCQWIACPDAGQPPFVTAYARRFTLPGAGTFRVHVSADERYELFLDGERVGRGPERGNIDHWYFETYDLRMDAGAHVLVARVWTLGFEDRPFAQHSLRPGFLLAAEGDHTLDLMATGAAPWKAKRLGGYRFVSPITAWGTGAKVVLDGDALDGGVESGVGSAAWPDAVPVAADGGGASSPSRNDIGPVHRLRPATLSAAVDAPWAKATVRLVADIAHAQTGPSPDGVGEVVVTHPLPIRAADDLPAERPGWERLIAGAGAVTIPARTRRRVLIDLNDYVCAYPEIVTTGGAGASVRVHWQEGLFNESNAKTKGNRDVVEGKYFVCLWHVKDGIGDLFRIGEKAGAGEERRFGTLWWECGRYIEVVVTTADAPLTLNRLRLHETRYPLRNEGAFESSRPEHAEITPILVRALQMCSHETYMDCPYYEQLMYVGDTRLEALATYAITGDDRLPRKALRMFDASRLPPGLTQSRYPTKVRQVIPPFSLWYVAMVRDYAFWRDDPAFVRSLLPTARLVIDHFAGLLNSDGLLTAADGWNFSDWVPAWSSGVPPDGASGISGVLNFHFALVLKLYAELEAAMGEPELAARAGHMHARLCERAVQAFYVPARGLIADDLAHTRFSEHGQCLALLAGALQNDAQRSAVARGLIEAPDLERTTIYFTHYLFEALYQIGRGDLLQERLAKVWFQLPALGLKTTWEEADPNTTRSDCHAWGAHPLYHYQASILGVRPDGSGFARVRIAPQLGALTRAHGTLPHPQGEIKTAFAQEGGKLTGEITLPDGVSGEFVHGGHTTDLHPGTQTVTAADG